MKISRNISKFWSGWNFVKTIFSYRKSVLSLWWALLFYRRVLEVSEINWVVPVCANREFGRDWWAGWFDPKSFDSDAAPGDNSWLNVEPTQNKINSSILRYLQAFTSPKFWIWDHLTFLCQFKTILPLQGRATLATRKFLEVGCYSVFLARFFVIFRVLGVIAGHWRAQIRVSWVL